MKGWCWTGEVQLRSLGTLSACDLYHMFVGLSLPREPSSIRETGGESHPQSGTPAMRVGNSLLLGVAQSSTWGLSVCSAI